MMHRETLSLMTSNSSGQFSEESTATSENESCDDVKSWQSTNSSSCSSCTDSGSDEGSVEWESEVRSDGELYYIVSDPLHQPKNSSEPVTDINIGTADTHTSALKDSTSKSWRNGGKLVRLIRRRESKRHRNNVLKSTNPMGGREKQNPVSQAPTNVMKEGTDHVVELNVDPWVKRNLGRRATISETLLGLVTVCHESEIFVTDYVPDSLASKQSLIKIGDKIASINGKVVTHQNFNALLEAINMPMTLYLGVCTNPFDKASSTDNKSDRISYQTPLAARISGQLSNHDDLKKLLCQSSVGVLYLQLDGMTEGGPEDQGVLYCYPGRFKSNFLSSIRGAFLTLFQLIPDISQSPPRSSSILVKGQLVHVIYVQEGRELLLIALPDCRCSLAEAMKQCSELVQMLQFTHQSLSRCFSLPEHTKFVDHVMCIFFSRLLFSDKWAEVTDVDSCRNMTMMIGPTLPQFELILPAAHLVPLPREAQMQIDDALSELESNDIGDSCEDLDCQRLYTILGSCLYHKGYLLASHFPHCDLLDVHVFCRQQGLLQLNQGESVHSLVIWKEVYPKSVSRGLTSSTSDSTYNFPEGRWFIMIVGQKQDMLVTLLEAGGCSASLDGHHSPDVFYVEAAQDTLQHLKKTGVSSIASEWLETQLRPKLISPEVAIASRNSSRRVNSLLGLRVHHDPIWQSSFSSILNSPSNRKSTDSLSAGKRRPSPDHSSSGPLHGGETSEDSASLVASLPSDDTVFVNVKSRSERDPTHVSHSDHEASEDSDSDWEASDIHAGRRPTSTTDLSDLHNSLLKNVEGTVPSKLSTGPENIVFHYVHIDINEGVMLSPVHSSYSTNLIEILSKFRSTAMQIHSLFQNTISFKKLKGVEASHSLINKSLVAIKEFGALFECNLPLRGNEKSPSSMNFWVVGRLFFMPASREVYVCYEDSAPQNLVELAFRLALTTTG
ncbi:protein inturned [Thrips palmi]|uniref:Protein inturned n=1 Tax=Thrips palmi TaxID=161013 RepID=A0A6P8Z8H9_THRPL|nr:protein inturned [Thrips palmi]